MTFNGLILSHLPESPHTSIFSLANNVTAHSTFLIVLPGGVHMTVWLRTRPPCKAVWISWPRLCRALH